ncbi:type II toxin-antitoxin system Phd/YefM family antitoxin [Pseudomonas sp. 18173]|uniref:type II toxin-antitoxin system Phd/YefM family antitoxin n=1 Tax=Pseudomonas sp. 18173 TaxID=3390055 RepID=UPI003D1F03B9
MNRDIFSELAPATLEKPRIFALREYSGYICPEYGREIMIVVPLAEAKNNLSKLVDDAAAGQIITIAKHGRALARLVPVGKTCGQRIGTMKGKLVLPDDFDAPLSDDMFDMFEGAHE